MGFSDFLSWKPHQPQEDVIGFKAQAYGSTVASLPPVLGTNPIPGNGVTAIGSNGIRQLPRHKPKSRLLVSTSHTSFRTGISSPALSVTSAGPKRLLPRTRSPSTLGRPNTAPDDHLVAPSDPAFQSRPGSSNKTRSRRNSLRQSVALLRKSDSNGDFRLAETSVSHGGSAHAPPVPPIPAAHSPAPTGSGRFSRSDTASMALSATPSLSDSFNRGPGFVDILDAQGEIRPSNFRSRLQAAGARDYGEDVAERNMPANTFESSNPRGTSYYATSNSPLLSGPRSGHLNSTLQRPRTVNFPKRVDSFDYSATVYRAQGYDSQPIEDDAVRHSHIRQRISRASSSSKHRPHPLDLQPLVSRSSSDEAAEPPEVPRVRGNSSSSRNRVRDSGSHSPHAATITSNTSRSHRWSSNADHASPTLQVPPRPHTRESTPRRKRRTSKGRAMHCYGLGELAVESTADAEFTSAAPAPGIPSFFRSSDNPVAHSGNTYKARSKSAHDPQRGGRMRSNSRPSSSSSAPSNPYPRTRSLGGLSLPPRPNLDDITEHIPPRTSSWRNWSISSSTPPASASDWSSDLFQRPHSRHTADTSIAPSGSIRSLTLGNLKDAMYPSPRADDELPNYYNIDEDAPRSPAALAGEMMARLMEGKGKQPLRNNWSPHDEGLGNHSESDNSSELGVSGLEADNVLFREGGYGNTGGGLPGLFDGRVSPAPSDWSIRTMTYDQTLDLIAPGGLRPPNTPSGKTTFGTLPALPSLETSSNDGGSDATSESGLDPKLDAKMAMKVRRELKRRTRVATIEKRHGKQPIYGSALNSTNHRNAPTSHPQHT